MRWLIAGGLAVIGFIEWYRRRHERLNGCQHYVEQLRRFQANQEAGITPLDLPAIRPLKAQLASRRDRVNRFHQRLGGR